MEKPVAVKFVVKNKFVLIWQTGNLYSENQWYQMTYAFVDIELKLVARVTTKSL